MSLTSPPTPTTRTRHQLRPVAPQAVPTPPPTTSPAISSATPPAAPSRRTSSSSSRTPNGSASALPGKPDLPRSLPRPFIASSAANTQAFFAQYGTLAPFHPRRRHRARSPASPALTPSNSSAPSPLLTPEPKPHAISGSPSTASITRPPRSCSSPSAPQTSSNNTSPATSRSAPTTASTPARATSTRHTSSPPTT